MKRFARILHQEICDRTHDVVIVGGGVMGLSTAFHIKSASPNTSVCVIERDPKYSQGATARSVGSIRQQFSVKENILLSMESFKFFSGASQILAVDDEECDIQLKYGSYLFLATALGKPVLEDNVRVQKSMGALVDLLTPTMLAERFPWMNTSDLAAASLGAANEGWCDPWLFLCALKKKAASLGVTFITGEVTDFETSESGTRTVNQVKVTGDVLPLSLSAGNVVMATGPWTGNIMRRIGFHLPVYPRKRLVFSFRASKPLPAHQPMLVIDPTGIYFRTESDNGNCFVAGSSPINDEDDNLDVDYDVFELQLWPILANRVKHFECVKLLSGWAGFYDYNTADENGLIGAVPGFKNLYVISGFTGHGFQQAPAAGRAISELILHRRFVTIDLANMSPARIGTGALLVEKNII